VTYGIRIPKLLSLLAFPRPERDGERARLGSGGRRPPVNVVRFAFQTMVGIGTLLALVGTVFIGVWLRYRRLPASAWFYRGVVAAGPLAFVALVAGVDHDRGRASAVDRLQGDAHDRSGHRREGDPGGLCDRSRSSISDWLSRSRGC